MDNEYAIAYKEVLEILKYISLEDYNKIPSKKIYLFKTYANKDYNFKYDPQKTLDEQNVSRLAKGIIAILFRDYWATPIQKEKIIQNQKIKRYKNELQKQQKYNTDIFKKENEKIDSECLELTKTSNKKWQTLLVQFIKKLLRNK